MKDEKKINNPLGINISYLKFKILKTFQTFKSMQRLI